MSHLIAGNWKMNGLTATGRELAGAVAAWMRRQASPPFELLVCPPAPLLVPVAEAIAGSGIALGAQDCHAQDAGAHTGDTSATLLADVGCRYVIVGHSERRADHGETSAEVHDKALAARRAGLVPIVCVGETEAERAAGHALEVIRRQVEDSVFEAASEAELVVAYEPVWAIGTGNVATPADVAEAHGEIRAVLRALLPDKVGDGVRILYGGSVKPDNAAGLLVVPNVDGALVGGASLKAADFQAIAAAVPDAPHPAEDQGLQSA